MNFKLIFILLMSMVMIGLVSAIPYNVDETSSDFLFLQYYDNETLGTSYPVGWTGNSMSYRLLINDTKYNGTSGYSLMVEDTESYDLVWYPNQIISNAQTGNVSIEFDINFDSINTHDFFIYLNDAGTDTYRVFDMRFELGTVYLCGLGCDGNYETMDNPVTSFEANKWYHIKITADVSDETNQNAWLSVYNYSESAYMVENYDTSYRIGGSFVGFQIFVSDLSSNNALYLDNLLYYKGTQVPQIPEEIPELTCDDFCNDESDCQGYIELNNLLCPYKSYHEFMTNTYVKCNNVTFDQRLGGTGENFFIYVDTFNVTIEGCNFISLNGSSGYSMPDFVNAGIYIDNNTEVNLINNDFTNSILFIDGDTNDIYFDGNNYCNLWAYNQYTNTRSDIFSLATFGTNTVERGSEYPDISCNMETVCSDNSDCGTCQICSEYQCANEEYYQDIKDECADNCDGYGACNYISVSLDNNWGFADNSILNISTYGDTGRWIQFYGHFSSGNPDGVGAFAYLYIDDGLICSTDSFYLAPSDDEYNFFAQDICDLNMTLGEHNFYIYIETEGNTMNYTSEKRYFTLFNDSIEIIPEPETGYQSTYEVSDFTNIVGNGLGMAGSTVVGLIPLIILVTILGLGTGVYYIFKKFR